MRSTVSGLRLLRPFRPRILPPGSPGSLLDTGHSVPARDPQGKPFSICPFCSSPTRLLEKCQQGAQTRQTSPRVQGGLGLVANIASGRWACRTGRWGWRRGAGEGTGPATETGEGNPSLAEMAVPGAGGRDLGRCGGGGLDLGRCGGASPRATARPDLQGPGASRNTVISHRQKTRTTTARKRSGQSPRDKAVLCSLRGEMRLPLARLPRLCRARPPERPLLMCPDALPSVRPTTAVTDTHGRPWAFLSHSRSARGKRTSTWAAIQTEITSTSVSGPRTQDEGLRVPLHDRCARWKPETGDLPKQGAQSVKLPGRRSGSPRIWGGRDRAGTLAASTRRSCPGPASGPRPGPSAVAFHLLKHRTLMADGRVRSPTALPFPGPTGGPSLRLCLPPGESGPLREGRAPGLCAGVQSVVTTERRVLSGKPIRAGRLRAGAAGPSSE